MRFINVVKFIGIVSFSSMLSIQLYSLFSSSELKVVDGYVVELKDGRSCILSKGGVIKPTFSAFDDSSALVYDTVHSAGEQSSIRNDFGVNVCNKGDQFNLRENFAGKYIEKI